MKLLPKRYSRCWNTAKICSTISEQSMMTFLALFPLSLSPTTPRTSTKRSPRKKSTPNLLRICLLLLNFWQSAANFYSAQAKSRKNRSKITDKSMTIGIAQRSLHSPTSSAKVRRKALKNTRNFPISALTRCSPKTPPQTSAPKSPPARCTSSSRTSRSATWRNSYWRSSGKATGSLWIATK